jgi:HxlR-like helix-turn-helix
MLTVTLRGLERDGLVTRTVRPTVPPRVDYALTPMGRTLLDTVRNLLEWADEHLPEIHAARAAYDRRSELLKASLDVHAGPLPASPAEGTRPVHALARGSARSPSPSLTSRRAQQQGRAAGRP